MSNSIVTSQSFNNSRDYTLFHNEDRPHTGTSFVTIEASAYEDMPSQLEVSVSAVLVYCKKKVLLPFFKLLAMLGWRPLLCDDQMDIHAFPRCINTFYSLFVVLLMVVGYILPYVACFRRDGFPPYQVKSQEMQSVLFGSNRTLHASAEEITSEDEPLICSGGSFSVYIFPDVLHLSAYMCTLYLMRVAEHEQLETLMERVFLQMSLFQTWFIAQRKMIKKLRWLLALGVFWVIVSVVAQILQVIQHDVNIKFRWFELDSESKRLALVFLMLVTVSWNDIICVAIATSYSVHCQLIVAYLRNLRRSVMEKTLSFQHFYKELQESRKFLNYLNNEQAIGISLLALNFGCKATTGIYGLVTKSSDPFRSNYVIASIFLTVFLWVGLLLYPCIQGVMLTETCSNIRKLGHELRARPFGYQDMAQEDLDSFLLYTSTLSMQARIFRIPVQASCLFLAFVCVVFTMVLLGQLGMIQIENPP